MDVQDIRDVVVIAALGALSLWCFVLLLIYTFIGYKTWRGVRRLNRLTDEQLNARLIAFNTRLRELSEEGALTGGGLVGLALGGLRWVREKRRPKKKRRFAALAGLRLPGR